MRIVISENKTKRSQWSLTMSRPHAVWFSYLCSYRVINVLYSFFFFSATLAPPLPAPAPPPFS